MNQFFCQLKKIFIYDKWSLYYKRLLAKEKWTLDFPTFSAIWTKDKWKQKGIEGDCLCMSRRDTTKGWTKNNVFLVARRDNQLRLRQLRNQTRPKNFTYKGKKYKDYKHLANHYQIEVQTARNWLRFKP